VQEPGLPLATLQWLVRSQVTMPDPLLTHGEWGWRPLVQLVGHIGCSATATAAVPLPQQPFDAQSEG